MLNRTQGGSNTCVNPINWRDTNGDGLVTIPEDIPPGDARIIPVFVTPFGSFNGSGNAVVLITNFASFYVTGSARTAAAREIRAPAPILSRPSPAAGSSAISSITSTRSTRAAAALRDFNSFGTCVAVLTQ